MADLAPTPPPAVVKFNPIALHKKISHSYFLFPMPLTQQQSQKYNGRSWQMLPCYRSLCEVRSSCENVDFEVITLDGRICPLASTTISTYHALFFFLGWCLRVFIFHSSSFEDRKFVTIRSRSISGGWLWKLQQCMVAVKRDEPLKWRGTIQNGVVLKEGD
ncbi:hypothetical protein AHAS_Ahas19G0071600 [Arachis hypogaea]